MTPPPLPQPTPPNLPPSQAPVVHVMRDKEHGNMPVAAFQFPPGWRAQSFVQWNYQNYSVPVTMGLQAQDATGTLRFELFPAAMFAWVEPAYMLMGMQQQGQSAFGQTTWKPMPGPEALANLVIPMYRGKMPGFHVVNAGPAPELPGLFNVQEQNVSGARATATYQVPGNPLREDFFAVHSHNTVPNYGPQGVLYQTNWGLLYIHSYCAPAAAFDAHVPVFQSIVRSLKEHPPWKGLAAQIVQQLAAQFNAWIQQGYSQIQAAVQASHAISANNDAMLATIEHNRRYSWSPTSTSSDHSARAFSNAMRGEDTYEDPYWGESQQSNQYDYVWTDGFGNYQQTNDAGFDPNVGGTVNWQVMQRKG